MTPDEIVNTLNEIQRKIKDERFRAIREKARLKYDIYKPIEQEIPKYDTKESYPIIEECIEAYKKLSKEDRELVRNVLKYEVCDLVVFYGVKMADRCLQFPNQKDFTNGLYGFGMGYHEWDIRDVWIWLSTLCDVAMRKNLSYNEYFESGEPFVKDLKDFLARPDINDILHVMGRFIVKDKDGKEHYNR